MKRTIAPALPHHVILRGNNRRRLFSRHPDYHEFIYQVERALERSTCQLHAITLMPNHVHMIATPVDADDMAGFVKRFAQRYAQARNKRRDASGKLFEQRYVAKPIETDEQLRNATYYSDTNASQAFLVDRDIEYPWSTFALHIGEPKRAKIAPRMWTPSPWYLSLGEDAAERARRYKEGVDGYLAELERRREEEVEYTRRLRRPDDTRASESSAMYGICGRSTPEDE